ncbi:UNVERIFIED_CONTAM: O-fucosyltransferase 36 [Sesamum latifolium]|uniref:O-fucosyltransferase family protein n=1 Tax=Sesamum latifolium TaxID=2727402 RepID=A0AAW2YEE9_9LAMI
MDLEASDEKDDRRHLISQSGRPNDVLNSPNTSRPSTFQIDDGLKSPFSGVCRRFKSRCLVAICLLVPILVLCFTIDFKNMLPIHFPRIEVLTNSSIPVNRMRGSELQALYLLKQQEFELFKMRNYTALVNKSELSVVNSSTSLNMSSANHDAAASPSSSVLEDLKSRIFSQISLNKRIQGVLLSSQENGDKVDLYENYTNANFLGWNRCGKVDQRLSERRTIEWKPRSDKYLFAICVSGQMSNHLICLEKHVFAALLDRVLVIPSAKPCFVDDDHVKKFEGLGLALSKIEAVWEEDVKQPKQRTAQDILEMFSSDDDLLQLEMCSLLMSTDSGSTFYSDILGKDFIALHFRRHGFLKFCNAKQPSCFYPVPQAADCINRVVERANSPVIYLSTDAADSETGLLQSLVVWNGKTIPLVQRPAVNSAEKWDALLYRHGLEGDSQVEAMLDKTICALSTVFIGSSGSTFTEDILRLRKDWGSASKCDEYLCEGELPNFIAEDE